MSKKVSVLLLVVFIVFVNLSGFTFAAPVDTTPYEVTQPSGEKFMAMQWGDEFYGAVAAVTGEVITMGQDSYWYYVELVGGKIFTRAKYKIDPKPLFAVSREEYNKFCHNSPSMNVRLPGQIGESIVDQTSRKIKCVVEPGYDLKAVKPQVTINRARHYAHGYYKPGYNELIDFTKPVEYTLSFQRYSWEENPIIENWTVESVVWDAGYKMFEVSLPGQVGSSVLDMKNNVVKLYMEEDTDLSELEPSIMYSSDFSGIQFSMVALNGETKQDFTKQIQYFVIGKNSYGEIVYSDLFTLVCSIIEKGGPERAIIKGTVSHAGRIQLYNEKTGEKVNILNSSSPTGGNYVDAQYDFIMTGIPEGRYKLYYYPAPGSYVDGGWYKDENTLSEFSTIEVKQGEIVDGISINAHIIPAIVPDQDKYEFTSKGIGLKSEPHRFKLNFKRSSGVTVESVSLIGTDKFDFVVVADNATGKTGLASTDNIYIDVVFKPLSEGEKNAQVLIKTNSEVDGVAKISLCGTMEEASIEKEEYKKITVGDVDGDGKINSTDTSLIKRLVLCIIEPVGWKSILFRASGDVNGDGNIDSIDLTYHKRYILEVINAFPAKDIEYVKGDINGDQKYSYKDVSALEGIVKGEIKDYGISTILCGDINEDGSVDAQDLKLLKQKIYGNSLIIEKANWYANTRDVDEMKFGDVSLHIVGHTTADSVTVHTWGDGVPYEQPLKLDSDNRFDEVINVSFTHQAQDKPFSVGTIVTAQLGSDVIKETVQSGILKYNTKDKTPEEFEKEKFEAEALAIYASGEIMAPVEMAFKTANDLNSIRSQYKNEYPVLNDISCWTNYWHGYVYKGGLGIIFNAETLKRIEEGSYHEWDAMNLKFGLEKFTVKEIAGSRYAMLDFDRVLNAKKVMELYETLPGVISCTNFTKWEGEGRIYAKNIDGNMEYLFTNRFEEEGTNDLVVEVFYFKSNGESTTLIGYEKYKPIEGPIKAEWWKEAQKLQLN